MKACVIASVIFDAVAFPAVWLDAVFCRSWLKTGANFSVIFDVVSFHAFFMAVIFCWNCFTPDVNKFVRSDAVAIPAASWDCMKLKNWIKADAYAALRPAAVPESDDAMFVMNWLKPDETAAPGNIAMSDEDAVLRKPHYKT